MAKKSSKSTKSKKQTASPVEKAAKKAYKANPKAFIISIVAIVLVIAIATAVVYFAFPDTWDKIVSMIVKDNQHSGLARGDGELLVHMLDVGQGDCIYIQLPDGKDMVIDCANYNDDGEYEKKTFDYLDKYIEDDTVEYLMLTHCDSDHVYLWTNFWNAIRSKSYLCPTYLPHRERLQKTKRRCKIKSTHSIQADSPTKTLSELKPMRSFSLPRSPSQIAK